MFVNAVHERFEHLVHERFEHLVWVSDHIGSGIVFPKMSPSSNGGVG